MSQARAYEPLHQKYRPQRFDQLVGQEAIAATLSNALVQNRIAPAYLFSGPRGTGKTSSARILARSLNCGASPAPTPEPCGRCEICLAITAGNALDVIEIDAASNTGVDNIRELIERSRFAPVQARWKVYVIDECHMLSTAAFNALLKTLEEPPPRVVFVLATTDPQRVLPTILSRCQRFDFRRIPQAAIARHLGTIAEQEQIGITPEALEVVAQRAQGGLRDAESLLDQLSLLPAPIEVGAIWELLGAVPEQELLHLAAALADSEPLGLIEACRQLLDRGREPAAVLQGLAALLRDLVLAAAAPDRPELSSLSPPFRPQLLELAQRLNGDRLLRWQSQLRGSEQQLRQSIQPRLWLEVLLLGLLAEPVAAAVHLPSPPAPQAPQAQPVAPAAPPVAPPSSPNAREPAAMPLPATPAPAALPPPPQPGPDPAGTQSLAELWQQILSCLELPSTRMLLSQQASLERLDSQRAVVRVSGNWIPMVQSRLPLLEQALHSALGSPRQLVLESHQAAPAPGPVSPVPAALPVPPAPAPVVSAAAAPGKAAPVDVASSAAESPPAAGPASSASSAVPSAAAAPLSAAPAPGMHAAPAPAPAPAPGTASPLRSLPPAAPQAPGVPAPLEEKARRLAEFFNGEVVSLLEEPAGD